MTREGHIHNTTHTERCRKESTRVREYERGVRCACYPFSFFNSDGAYLVDAAVEAAGTGAAGADPGTSAASHHPPTR
jgi:hypothetical protein